MMCSQGNLTLFADGCERKESRMNQMFDLEHLGDSWCLLPNEGLCEQAQV